MAFLPLAPISSARSSPASVSRCVRPRTRSSGVGSIVMSSPPPSSRQDNKRTQMINVGTMAVAVAAASLIAAQAASAIGLPSMPNIGLPKLMDTSESSPMPSRDDKEMSDEEAGKADDLLSRLEAKKKARAAATSAAAN